MFHLGHERVKLFLVLATRFLRSLTKKVCLDSGVTKMFQFMHRPFTMHIKVRYIQQCDKMMCINNRL